MTSIEHGNEPRTDNRVETVAQVRGSSALLVGKVLNIGLSLALQVLLVRSLSRSDFGAFGYALSIAASAMVIVSLGTTKAVPRFLAVYDEAGDRERFAGTLMFEFSLICGLSITAFVGLVSVRALADGQLTGDPLVFTLTTILILTAPQEGIDKVLEAFAAVSGQTKAIFFRKYLLEPLLRFGAVLLLVVLRQSVTFLAVAYLVAGVLGTAIYLQVLVRQLRVSGRLSDLRRGLHRMPGAAILRFSAPLLVHDLVFVGISTIGVVLIGKFSGIGGVADYRAVYPVARINQVVGWTFAVLYMPLAGRFFSRGDSEGMRQAYWHSAAWLCVLTLPIYLLTGPFADPLTTTAFGSQYRGAGTALAVLSTGFYLNMSLGFNTLTLQTFGHLRFTVVVDVISIVVFIAIALVLVPDHGALGAAIAAAVSLLALNLGAQIGIWRMGLGGFDATYVSVYVVVFAAIGVCWLTELVLEPALPFALLTAAAASFAVLWATRHRLDLLTTFPEVSRIPLMRTLFR